MSNLNSYLTKYDYSFPKELVAQSPATSRDAARLLIYNREIKRIRFDTFLNLPKYLPARAVLVFNQTKVIPARFEVKKETGGKAVLLYLSHDKKMMTVLSDRRLTVGTTLALTRTAGFRIHSQHNKYYHLIPTFPLSSLFSFLDRYGRTPLPPYIKHTPLSEQRLRREYQAIFARQKGSVAAPTASLHFTARLLNNLKRAGHDARFITLRVGLGTFAPLTDENLEKGTLHKEYYSVDSGTARMLNRAKREGRPIIAVGTTVVRTLEHAANQHGKLTKLNGTTDLFIREGYHFKFIDGIITNFHVPQSSLLMLVSAYAGRGTIRRLYQAAIQKKFRLFSFGDGMLALP